MAPPPAVGTLRAGCINGRISGEDLADTSGDPLPEVPGARLLDGDAPTQMWDALATQVVGAGFTVQLVDEIASCPGAHGVSDMLAKTVQVATTGRSRAAQAKCLAHELAHVLLHRGVDYRAERGRFEVEAESVAYLVSAAFGLDTMDYTLGYVTSWANGDTDLVLATAQTVQRCARAVIDLALPELAGGERGEAA